MAQKSSNPLPLKGKPEINYPCVWQYKVIGTDQALVQQAIEEICAPVTPAISYSHCSSSGKYHSLNAEVEVQDDEARISLYQALQNHPDIKVVL